MVADCCDGESGGDTLLLVRASNSSTVGCLVYWTRWNFMGFMTGDEEPVTEGEEGLKWGEDAFLLCGCRRETCGEDGNLRMT